MRVGTLTGMGRLAGGLVALAAAGASLAVAAGTSSPSAPGPALALAPSCSRSGWVSVWSMPPSDAAGAPLPAGVTLRQLVYPSLGGSRVRVRFSNAFSPVPVVIGAASLGLQSHGAGLDPASVTALRFGGHPGVTLPPGGEIISDPVSFSFRSLQELSVSSYLSTADPSPTEHLLGGQPSYVATSGNHVADSSGRAFVPTARTGTDLTAFPSVRLLSGLDVLPAGSAGAVVALGDSITDGLLRRGTATNVTWPDQLARRLTAAGVPLAVDNAGISGNELLADLQGSGDSAQNRFDSDVLRQSGVRTVVLLEGINDLRQGRPVAELEAADTALIRRAHAAGLRIVLATLTPAGSRGDGGLSARGAESRVTFNIWIRSQRLADGVIDFDAAVADPRYPAQLAPAFDGGDHLHLTAAGYTALGNAVPLSLLLPAGCLNP